MSWFGDEKWLILEQVFKSALHCSKQSIARHCLDQLEKQFKSTSRRVTTLNAMYYESIEDFKSADDIYSNLLDENETDAIVQKRQISLLKEKNQIREAISQLNSYLELYQVILRLHLSLINSVSFFSLRLTKKHGVNYVIFIFRNTIMPKLHFVLKTFF